MDELTVSGQNHETLLKDLVIRLETYELRFYQNESKKNYVLWHLAATTALFASIAATILAGINGVIEFGVAGKVLLIVIPAIGTFAAGLLNLWRFREKEALRETGAIDVDDIIMNAKSRLASARTDDEFKEAYHAIRERFFRLQQSQHQGDAALRSDLQQAIDNQRVGDNSRAV